MSEWDVLIISEQVVENEFFDKNQPNNPEILGKF